MGLHGLSVIGARQPSYALIPPSVDRSAGRAAIALMRELDLDLDGWQEDVILAGMGRDRAGHWVADSVIQLVSRQNGKTPPLFARVLWGLLLGGERRAMWSAHEFKTASESFLDLQSLCEHPRLADHRPKFTVSNGKEGVRFADGQRILFVARSKTSGRGFGADVLVLDEAFALTDYQMASLLPAMSARKAPQAWYASSAPLPESVVLPRMAKAARTGDVVRTTYLEWCAEAGDDPQAESTWAKANPAYGIRITERAILQELAMLGDEDFARERLGVWREDQAMSVFGLGVWASAADVKAKTPRGGRFAIAADVAPDRSRATIAAAGQLKDGRVVWEVLQTDRGASWVAPALAALAKRHRSQDIPIVVEESGQGRALALDLEDLDVKFTRITSTEMQAACSRAFDGINEGAICHLEQAELTAAVDGARQREIGDSGWVWSRRRSGVDITPLVACTLANYALVAIQPLAEVWVL